MKHVRPNTNPKCLVAFEGSRGSHVAMASADRKHWEALCGIRVKVMFGSSLAGNLHQSTCIDCRKRQAEGKS